MTRRNVFRGPGFSNLDAGLYKNIKFTERVSLQLRFEAYNLFNHANATVIYGFPDNEISNDSVPVCYSCTGTSADRRNIQIAGKIVF